eukprot:scaffold79180_cov20-Tisochrysis_lutea.AAC.1
MPVVVIVCLLDGIHSKHHYQREHRGEPGGWGKARNELQDLRMCACAHVCVCVRACKGKHAFASRGVSWRICAGKRGHLLGTFIQGKTVTQDTLGVTTWGRKIYLGPHGAQDTLGVTTWGHETYFRAHRSQDTHGSQLEGMGHTSGHTGDKIHMGHSFRA